MLLNFPLNLTRTPCSATTLHSQTISTRHLLRPTNTNQTFPTSLKAYAKLPRNESTASPKTESLFSIASGEVNQSSEVAHCRQVFICLVNCSIGRALADTTLSIANASCPHSETENPPRAPRATWDCISEQYVQLGLHILTAAHGRATSARQ